MARPREFDETTALDAAVLCFWRKGYEATSVRDLAESMGVTGASMYNAFGDKRTLYKLALNRYLDLGARERINRFEHSLPPYRALQTFFSEIIELSVRDKERKGCLLVNSALELAPHDPEFARVIRKVLQEIQGFFQRCVESGQADGTIATSHPAQTLSQTLLSVLLGLRVLARTRPERDLLEGVVQPVFALLIPDQAPRRRATGRPRSKIPAGAGTLATRRSARRARSAA